MFIRQPVFKALEWKTNLRQARVVHFAILAAAFLQLFVLFVLTNNRESPAISLLLSFVLLFMGVLDFFVALAIRAFLFRRATAALQANLMDPQAQQQWRTVNIISSAFAYAVFLFGWVLAFLGGARWAYLSLWGIAAISFFIFIPQPPLDESLQANTPTSPK